MTSLDEMRRELLERYERLKRTSSNPDGLPEFLGRADMTLKELNEEIKVNVEKMSCEELYKATDEARIAREAIFEPVTTLILSDFIHHASVKLAKECPEHYERLTRKYKLRELGIK